MKSLIITHSMFQDQEVLYPYYRLQEEGVVKIAAEKVGKIKGILGTEVESNRLNEELDTRSLKSFDLLVLPGGVKAMEKLRQCVPVLRFIENWSLEDKPIASICSGAQMLISARIRLKGRRLSAYPAMSVDVENAGAIYLNEPVVIDDNLVSSSHYMHMAQWMPAAIRTTRRHMDLVWNKN